MTRSSERPPRGRIPTVKSILIACPWDAERNPGAKDAARRLATQLQAREYLLWLLELHPPNLSVAHGVTELMWARDGVILEEIVCGYAKWHLGTSESVTRDYQRSLQAVCADANLRKPLLDALERARGGRNRATHARKAPEVTTDYRKLTSSGLRAKIDFDVPWRLMRALQTTRSAERKTR